jgi:hypothetical protein
MITSSKQISTHFHSREFRCQHCGNIKIDQNLVTKLEHIFNKLNASKCIISSGYRCATYDKKIGGFLGRHYEGLAADCCFYDKQGKIIPSKIVICVAYDLKELNGIAKINNNYVHLDNRQGSTYRGDETKGNSSYWTNPYTYFGVTRTDVEKYTGTTIKYQAHGQFKKWYANVTKGSSDYAGVFGVPIDAICIDKLKYRAKTGGKWLPEVVGRTDYAGIMKKPITDIAIQGATYRVHTTDGKWHGYVSGYNVNDSKNGYAGVGKTIDAFQIK